MITRYVAAVTQWWLAEQTADDDLVFGLRNAVAIRLASSVPVEQPSGRITALLTLGFQRACLTDIETLDRVCHWYAEDPMSIHAAWFISIEGRNLSEMPMRIALTLLAPWLEIPPKLLPILRS
jgi:hypothetical protein